MEDRHQGGCVRSFGLVYTVDASHDDLRDPGKFLTLDTKLLAALTKVAKGELEGRPREIAKP